MADAGAGEIDWQAVADHCQHMVGWLCKRYRLSAEDAEDVAAEVMVRAWANRDRYDPRRPLRTWLYSIGAHAAIDLLRRQRHRQAASLEVVAWRLIDPGERPPDIAERADEAQRVAAVLADLPRGLGRLLAQRHGDGRSTPDVAAEHGLPVTTVKMRLHRGRQLFRERWTA